MGRGRKIALMIIGWVFVGLGVVGAVLPVMPTTPFMLVALWCFAKSSDRFHAWLFYHPVFGPPLRDWEINRVIPLYAKVFALGSMAISIVYVVGFSQAPWWAMAAMGGTCTAGAVFILSKPSRKPVQ
ncbi:YbaN family protein [Paramagnetospirillum magneticum]|nr:YbaN family protein [Paramagnetospirillum magneticum]